MCVPRLWMWQTRFPNGRNAVFDYRPDQRIALCFCYDETRSMFFHRKDRIASVAHQGESERSAWDTSTFSHHLHSMHPKDGLRLSV